MRGSSPRMTRKKMLRCAVSQAGLSFRFVMAGLVPAIYGIKTQRGLLQQTKIKHITTKRVKDTKV